MLHLPPILPSLRGYMPWFENFFMYSNIWDPIVFFDDEFLLSSLVIVIFMKLLQQPNNKSQSVIMLEEGLISLQYTEFFHGSLSRFGEHCLDKFHEFNLKFLSFSLYLIFWEIISVLILSLVSMYLIQNVSFMQICIFHYHMSPCDD